MFSHSLFFSLIQHTLQRKNTTSLRSDKRKSCFSLFSFYSEPEVSFYFLFNLLKFQLVHIFYQFIDGIIDWMMKLLFFFFGFLVIFEKSWPKKPHSQTKMLFLAKKGKIQRHTERMHSTLPVMQWTLIMEATLNPGRDSLRTFLQSTQGKNNQRCDTGYGWFSDSTEPTPLMGLNQNQINQGREFLKYTVDCRTL